MISNEWDLIRRTLRAFGYAGVEEERRWFPRHCFGDTVILFRGYQWTLTDGKSKAAGNGYLKLVRAMAVMRVQPFDRENES